MQLYEAHYAEVNFLFLI